MQLRARNRAALLVGSVVFGLAAATLSAVPAAAIPGSDSAVFVNEFHYDNASTDSGEFIEIAGPAGTDVSGWSIVRYNGSTPSAATVYPVGSATALSGTIPDQQGGYGTLVVDFPPDGLQNGTSDGFALVNGTTVVQLLSYEGMFTASNGPAASMNSTNLPVSQSGSEPIGSSLQLTGTGTTAGDFSWVETEGATANTKGQPNTGQTFGSGELPEPQLSEIRIDQTGTDNDEYVEISGAPQTALDGLSLLVIGDGTGGSGVIENVVDLTGRTIGATGYFVVAESTFTLGTADLVAGLNFENGDNVTQLLVRDFSGTNGQDLDTNDDGVLDVTPWSAVVDRVALIVQDNPPTTTEFHYGPPTVGPDGTAVPGHAFRCDDGWRIGAFDPVAGDDTPGAVNACEVVPPPPAEALISQIQGSGAVSADIGQILTVEAVVTAVKPGLTGFYLQEEDADNDADPATSEAIFVFGSSTVGQVEVGQLVRVTGTVGEFAASGSSQTQLSSATVEVLENDVALPATVEATFPVPSTTYLERFEGMLVELVDELVISEYFNYDRFGEVVLAKPLDGQDRLYTPTGVVDPGPAAQALAAEQALRIITLDDYFSGQNPPVIPHPGNGEPFSPSNSFRGGDTVTGVVGVIDHTFGLYRIQPTEYGEYQALNPRSADVPDVGGSIQVASFNVLNYFLTLDQSGNRCGPLLDQDCRGADSQAEFDRQRVKIVTAIAELDADVVGLMEMENSTGVEPAADLVAGLNDLLGAGTYDYIDTGVIGTDAIRLGFLFKPGTVRPVGDHALLDSSVDPRFIDSANRPMLTQTFDELATGGRVTISVNHLKSKGSACAGDPDTGDGQGNCNLTRTAAAEAIVDFLAGDPTSSGDPDHLVIGDLNSYDHEDPIRALEAAGYTDLIRLFGDDFSYGYVFDGKVGYLDHALSNDSLTPQVTGATEWHINADEPDILDYNLDFGRPATFFAPDQYRSSDHDPALVGLDLVPATPERCYADGSQTVNSFTPGVRANGSVVPPPSGGPDKALVTADGNAVTLGLDGELILEFARPVQNNNGSEADLRIVDVADAAIGREDAAVVYGSWDGQTWVELGRVVGTGTVDLGALSAVSYVKVVDDTPQRVPAATDGYDLDAVDVLTGCA
jgi:predicted extracellular nuclease